MSSNARARAQQLHRAALNPRRPFAPVGVELTAEQLAAVARVHPDEYHRKDPEIACADCGLHVCGCSDGKKIARALGLKPAAQAPSEQVVLPKGWRRDEKEPERVFYAGPNDNCRVERGFTDARWWGCCMGGRGLERVQARPFTNMHAAMLCALGCEVVQNGYGDGIWRVTTPDSKVWPPHKGELPALVERLTAERAAKVQRRFEWQRGSSYDDCVIGGLRAWYMHQGLASWTTIAHVHGKPHESLAIVHVEEAGSWSDEQRRAWCEAELTRALDRREAKAQPTVLESDAHREARERFGTAEGLGREPSGKAGGLPPGWKPYAGLPHNFKHTSTVGVWRTSQGDWSYSLVDCPDVRVGGAPTRDEAMALALGWYQDDSGNRDSWFVDKPGGGRMQASPRDDEHGPWTVAKGPHRDLTATALPSLPHAIAWARGDA